MVVHCVDVVSEIKWWSNKFNFSEKLSVCVKNKHKMNFTKKKKKKKKKLFFVWKEGGGKED